MDKKLKENSVDTKIKELEEKFKKQRKQFGITLVALIVTIVILLIVSGIVIAQLTDSGLIGRSWNAKNKYQNSQELENNILTSYENGEIVSVRDNSDSSPVGTVISCIRVAAPEGYLVCDGTEYNISQYPELAEEIRKVYNGYNTETAGKFKVPDLRGEFLRGSGENLHTNQGSGVSIGSHQDATIHGLAATDGHWGGFVLANSQLNNSWDYHINAQGVGYAQQGISATNDNSRATWYTSRPTNTAVLYCIKAK